MEPEPAAARLPQANQKEALHYAEAEDGEGDTCAQPEQWAFTGKEVPSSRLHVPRICFSHVGI